MEKEDSVKTKIHDFLLRKEYDLPELGMKFSHGKPELLIES